MSARRVVRVAGGRGAFGGRAGDRAGGRGHRLRRLRYRSRVGRADVVSGAASGGVSAVAATLRAGAPPSVAWRRGWGVRSRDGVPDWSDVVERCGGDRAAGSAVVAAARLAAATGAPLASVLDRVGAALAEEADVAARRRAAFAGPQATVRLLTWLPAFGLVLGAALGADPVGVLLDGRGGTVLLVASAVLTWCGRWWSRRLLEAAASAGDRR